ncbi:MAG: DUF3631 domain-containing protein, partial [Candidatus Kryptoniota bacterium]
MTIETVEINTMDNLTDELPEDPDFLEALKAHDVEVNETLARVLANDSLDAGLKEKIIETAKSDSNPLSVLLGLGPRPEAGKVRTALEIYIDQISKMNPRPSPLQLLQFQHDAIAILKTRKVSSPARWVKVAFESLAQRSDPNDAGTSIFPKLEPWPEPVDGAGLLDDLAAIFKRYVVLPPHAETALALWTVFSYCLNAANTAPILYIRSPEKRCGKTLLQSILSCLVYRPIPTSNITGAAIYRVIEQWRPTLILDEVDTFVKGNEELRGVLNSGHTRSSAFVIRCSGEDLEPKRFSTWSCKCLAGIGHLADTIEDRAIIISLNRKLPSEHVEPFRRVDTSRFEILRRKILKFAEDNLTAIRNIRPEFPEALNDRARDNWEPLLAIADLAGADWLAKAQAAAIA